MLKYFLGFLFFGMLFFCLNFVVASYGYDELDCDDYSQHQDICQEVLSNRPSFIVWIIVSSYEEDRQKYLELFGPDFTPKSIAEYPRKTFSECWHVFSDCFIVNDNGERYFYDKEVLLEITAAYEYMYTPLRDYKWFLNESRLYEEFIKYPKQIVEFVYNNCLIEKVALKESLYAEEKIVYVSSCNNTTTTTNYKIRQNGFNMKYEEFADVEIHTY